MIIKFLYRKNSWSHYAKVGLFTLDNYSNVVTDGWVVDKRIETPLDSKCTLWINHNEVEANQQNISILNTKLRK